MSYEFLCQPFVMRSFTCFKEAVSEENVPSMFVPPHGLACGMHVPLGVLVREETRTQTVDKKQVL